MDMHYELIQFDQRKFGTWFLDLVIEMWYELDGFLEISYVSKVKSHVINLD